MRRSAATSARVRRQSAMRRSSLYRDGERVRLGPVSGVEDGVSGRSRDMTSVKKLTANPFQFIGQPFRRGVWLSSSIMFCALVIWRFVEPAAGTDAGRSYPPERLLTFLESI